MNFLQFLLFAKPAQDGEAAGGGGMSMLLMLGAIILVFYFFMIRPQQKKQKQMQNFRDTLKRGDKIVTIGGIHGKITDVQEGTFIIEVEDGTKLRIEKAAVAIDPNAPATKKD
ncbi:MAG: preprotein translocase subunit YajC [Lentimicrobiaceae bacterium]|nr:preprotein translocase subunit YajC [Lentimicrobiaceae bacterium]